MNDHEHPDYFADEDEIPGWDLMLTAYGHRKAVVLPENPDPCGPLPCGCEPHSHPHWVAWLVTRDFADEMVGWRSENLGRFCDIDDAINLFTDYPMRFVGEDIPSSEVLEILTERNENAARFQLEAERRRMEREEREVPCLVVVADHERWHRAQFILTKDMDADFVRLCDEMADRPDLGDSRVERDRTVDPDAHQLREHGFGIWPDVETFIKSLDAEDGDAS